MTQSISDLGFALEKRPPPGLKYFPVAGRRGFTLLFGGLVRRSKTSAGSALTLFFLTQCPGPKREGGTHTAPSAGLKSSLALPCPWGARLFSLDALVLDRLFRLFLVLELVVMGRLFVGVEVEGVLVRVV